MCHLVVEKEVEEEVEEEKVGESSHKRNIESLRR